MFTNEIAIYGSYGDKARELKDTGLFDRILDVYLAAGVVGIIFEKKGVKKVEKTSVKIFAGQLNNELTRIKYLSSIAFLIENSQMKGNEVSEKELLRQTFGDWFGESDKDNNKKYDLFERYALGGIEILHSKIISSNKGKESYYENFYLFIEEIRKLELNSDMDRIINGALSF